MCVMSCGRRRRMNGFPIEPEHWCPECKADLDRDDEIRERAARVTVYCPVCREGMICWHGGVYVCPRCSDCGFLLPKARR